MGSPFQRPINIGQAYINGFDLEIGFKSQKKKYEITSYLSNYIKSDFKAFQLQPDWIFKNKFSTLYRKFNVSFIYKIESEMQLTNMNRNGGVYYDNIPRRTNIDFFISRNIKYKFFEGLIEFSGKNLIREVFEVDNLYFFQPKYLLSLKLNL